MARGAAQLYEDDFYAWTREQVRALRQLAATRPDAALDVEHLIDEVADLGKSERDAVRSHARTILEHLLKLEHAASAAPRGGWKVSVTHARVSLQDKLTPSLQRDLVDQLPRLYAQARLQAVVGLEAHGEATAAAELPQTCPYRLDQVLAESWFPDLKPGGDG